MRGTLSALGLAWACGMGGAAVAQDASTVVTSASERGRELSLTFPQNPLSVTAREAVFCARPVVGLVEAKLWMPDMGHGSSPTRLAPLSNGCVKIERVNFLMSGHWEMRVKLTDGDRGVLAFDVAE